MRIGTTLSLATTLLLTASSALSAGASRTIVTEGPFPKASVVSDPVTMARAALAHVAPRTTKLELRQRSATVPTTLGALRIVKLQQEHRGIPVLNRGAGVALRPNGSAAFATVQVEDRLPADITPKLSSDDAAKIAARLTGLEAKAKDAKLVVFPIPSGPRLSWLVVPSGRTLDRRMGAVPYAPVVILDAESGARLAGWNAVRTAHARVYETNPVKTPKLIDVSLPLEPGAMSLANHRVVSLNCIDRRDTRNFHGVDIRVCHLEQTASADDDGNFLYEPAPDSEAEDAFSEVSLFHHTNRAYEYFASLGMTDLPVQVSTISNLRFAEGFFADDPSNIGDTQRPLVPYQNAFYVAGSEVFGQLFDVGGPGLWFGQGPKRDYSYDGDVVYHELGHAVVDHTIQFPYWFRADEQGLSPAPGAMNEGIADYFAAALSGDPIVGEYAIGDLDLEGLEGIRDISASDACPANLIGEVHADSVFFSAGLWKMRASLNEADRPKLDKAVFDVLATAHGDIGYEDFAELLLASVKASPLGESVAKELERELMARGILPACERRLVWEGAPLDGTDPFSQNAFFAPGTNDAAVGPLFYAPGVLQFQVPLQPTGQLVIKFEKLDTGPSVAVPFRPKVLVRWGSEPISFTWSSSDVTSNADATLTPQIMASANSYRAHISVPEEVTHASVMIVNTGEEQGLYKQVDFAFDEDGDDLPPDVAASDKYGSRSQEGCGCEAPGKAPSQAAWLSGLALLASMALRRKRRAAID